MPKKKRKSPVNFDHQYPKRSSPIDKYFGQDPDNLRSEKPEDYEGKTAELPEKVSRSQMTPDDCEIPLWKPPYIQSDAEQRRFDKRLENFIQPLTQHEILNYTEEQVLAILMVNYWDFNSATSDLKHYVTTADQFDILTQNEVHTVLSAMEYHGSDLYKISRSNGINYENLVNYYFLQFNKFPYQIEKSFKELVTEFEMKQKRKEEKEERERKKQDKSKDTANTRSSVKKTKIMN